MAFQRVQVHAHAQLADGNLLEHGRQQTKAPQAAPVALSTVRDRA
jgi:hypothetical protein